MNITVSKVTLDTMTSIAEIEGYSIEELVLEIGAEKILEAIEYSAVKDFVVEQETINAESN